MKVLIVKSFQAHCWFKLINFERMHVYNMPEQLANSIIAQGYAVKFGFISELPMTLHKQALQVEVLQ